MKILYIEDDQANRQLVSFMIERRDDIHLELAENGGDGLALAVEVNPHLIFLDLSLPDMTGYEVLKKLKQDEKTCHIPVIAVSGDSGVSDIAVGLNAGLDGYLTKPLDVMKFYATIDSYLKNNP